MITEVRDNHKFLCLLAGAVFLVLVGSYLARKHLINV